MPSNVMSNKQYDSRGGNVESVKDSKVAMWGRGDEPGACGTRSVTRA